MPTTPPRRQQPSQGSRIELDVQIQDQGPDRYCATMRIKATKAWFATVSYRMQPEGSTAQEFRVRRAAHNTMEQEELIRLVREYRAAVMLSSLQGGSQAVSEKSSDVAGNGANGGASTRSERNAGIEPLSIEAPLPINRALPPASRRRLYLDNGRITIEGNGISEEFGALVRDFFFEQVRGGADIRDLSSILQRSIVEIEQDAILGEGK